MTSPYSDRFLPTEGVYLLSHSVGLQPVSARDACLADFFDPWAEGETAWDGWLEQLTRFRSAVAQLLGGTMESVCPQSNLSSSLVKVLGSGALPAERKELVYTEMDFPSMAYVLQQAARLGFAPRLLPADADLSSPDTWREALGPQTAAVLVTHVQSNTGRQLPVAEIAYLARERGVVSIIDAAQSAGCVPLDVTAWEADFVMGSCVKWLCGGPGAGWMWIHPDTLQRCEPIDVGWFSHESPFDYDFHHFRYAPDALRFWGGTPSVLPYAVAANSIETLLDIGIDAIRAHNLALVDQLIEALPEEFVQSPRDAGQRGGTAVIDAPGREAELEQRLREAGVKFDRRPHGLRISPHIYTGSTDIETVSRAIRAML